MFRFASLFAAVVLVSTVLTGCGGPPEDQVKEEVKKAVYAANMAMFVGTKDNCEVVSIKIASWTKEKFPGGGPTMYSSSWTAKLRFKEQIACILAEVDGKNIVQVVAEKGDDLPMEGKCGAVNVDGKWESHASAQSKNGDDFMGPGAWKPIYDKVPDLKMGYPVISNGMQSGAKFRSQNFEPISRFKPYVIEGSAEAKKMQAEAAERAQKAQAAAIEQQRLRQEQYAAQQKQQQEEAAARQKQYQEEQARLQAEAAERQRLAQEEYQRKQAEAAEKARLAQEEAKKKAAEQRHAQLLAVLKPFQSATGAVITAEAGANLGTVILDAAIDDPNLSVSGHAINLREMPFKEFTFTGKVDDRGSFTFTSSLGGDPVVYGASGDKLASRAGFTIAALPDADRAKMETLIALGKRLGSAPAASLVVETIEAEAAKTREPQLRLSGLNGAVIFRNRLDPRVNPLFSADMASNKAYAWKGGEVVAVRLNDPVKGAGIFIRGTAAPSTEMVVTINGVHKVTVPTIPKLGDVIIALPADLEVFDITFQATGSVTARTIGLIK